MISRQRARADGAVCPLFHALGAPPRSCENRSLSSPFRALRSRNFRLFIIGQGISLTGTWMTRLATSWLVYRVTDSAFLLGVVSFAGQLPAFFLPALAGVWVDRWDRHRVLIATQVLAMLQSLTLAALTLSGHIQYRMGDRPDARAGHY